MKNLWDNKNIEEYILKLYFDKKVPIKRIYRLVKNRFKKELENISNNQIKRDIGRIIHRKSQNKKLNRRAEPIGKCPKCGREIFARNRTRDNEMFSCICDGNSDNTCDFKLTKKAYGIVLYNSVIEKLLKLGQTRNIKNLHYNNSVVSGNLEIDLEKRGFLNIHINNCKG